jgi:hypothetical protein
MVLKLDPRYPLVWRSPDGVQFGVATPIATIDHLSEADERMIAALTEGISESGLQMVGTSAGANSLDVAALLQSISPALTTPRPLPRRVLVTGAGATAASIARAVAASGHILVRDDPDLVVMVAHYVLSPEQHGAWLRRDIPHLAVVIADTAVDVGPIVEPGLGPCLYCALRDRTEADRAWPAIAAQLSGRSTLADDEVLAGEVAAVVARLVRARLERGAASIHESLRLDIATGVIEATGREARADCGCLEVRGRSESDSPGGAPVAMLRRRPLQPTTA